MRFSLFAHVERPVAPVLRACQADAQNAVRCQAPAADGQSCADAPCEFPAECVDTSCRIPAPATCG